MKKIKLLLFLLIAILTLSFNQKVLAEEVPGLLECQYGLEGSSNINNGFVFETRRGKPYITFVYTDIVFNRTSNFKDPNELYIYKTNGFFKELSSLSDSCSNTDKNAFCHINDGKTMLAFTKSKMQFFEKSKEQNGKCPLYLYVAGGSGNTARALIFSNKKPDSSKVLVLGSLSKNQQYTIDPIKQGWQHISYASGACHELNLNIFFEMFNNHPTLMASIEYSDKSGFYKNSAKQVQTFPVRSYEGELGQDLASDRTEQIKYLYNLLKFNKIDKGYVVGNSGDEALIIGEKSSGTNSCVLEKTSLTKWTCMDLADFEAEVNAAQGSFTLNAVSHYENASNLVDARLDQIAQMQDAEKSAYIESYHSLFDIITSALVKGKDADESEKGYQNFRDTITDSYEKVCGRYKTEAGSLLKEYEKEANMNKEKTLEVMERLHNTLDDVINKLDELGYVFSEDEFQTIEEVRDFEQEFESYANVSDVLVLLGFNANLTYKADCGIISRSLRSWLIQLLDLTKIGALVLTIILGMLDFFGGLASGNPDTMKKAWKKFSKRLIAVVLLFLLPVILEFLLGLVNITGLDSNNPLCGLK